jgi:hypothetical protein
LPSGLNNRVRWLDYDSGVKAGERTCTVSGCTASHAAQEQEVVSDFEFYAPLKENTNRFVKR